MGRPKKMMDGGSESRMMLRAHGVQHGEQHYAERGYKRKKRKQGKGSEPD